MKAQEFCYWLQGYFELTEPDAMTVEQTEMVKRHLALVFIHDIDPKQGTPEHQAELQAAHDKPGRPQIGGTGPGGEVYRC